MPRIRTAVVLHGLSLSDDYVLVDHEALHTDRTPRVDLVRAYAYLRTLAEPEAVGEPGVYLQ